MASILACSSVGCCLPTAAGPLAAAQGRRQHSQFAHRRCNVVTRAQPEDRKATGRKPSLPIAPPSRGGRQQQPQQPGGGEGAPEELEEAFRLFDLQAYNERFDVPWGGWETARGMVAWVAAFGGVGLAFIPIVAALAGPKGFAGLSATDRSLAALVNQVAETAASIAVIRWNVAKFEPLPPELFKYDLSEPFRKPRGWLMWGLLGVALSPLVVYASAALSEGVGYYGGGGVGGGAGGRGTVDAVSSLITMDFSTYASLMATTALLAPVLEETVFRGFLLTSLTRWVPVPAAVALSSLAFGFVHLTPRDFPQLTSLGLLLGFSYVRSRNLLTPILIHGAWNGGVLTLLYVLASQGIDIQELIHAT